MMQNFLAAFLGRSGLVLSAPTADGTAVQAIVTDGNKVLSFAGPFAPLTGAGTSGTWGISITGTAASATVALDAALLDGLDSTAFALASHVHSAADITSGTLPLARGGTNATTAAGARASVLPAMAGNTLKVLRVNAGETDAEWATVAAGSGDVVGPASAVSANLASFSGTTGKLIQDSGVSAASFAAASHEHSAAAITSGTLLAVRGGTGFGAYTIGDLPYADSTTTLAKRAVGAAGTVLIGGTTPAWSASPTLTSILIGDGLVGTPSIAFSADSDTGFYRVSSNSIAITTGGLENIRFQQTTQSALMTIPTATLTGLVIREAASQTANLLEAQNSSSVSHVYVGPSSLPSDGTKNFFNITGTFPSSSTNAVNAVDIQITTAGSSGYNQRALQCVLISGWTGNSSSNAGLFSNQAAGTLATYSSTSPQSYQPLGNRGNVADARATTVGNNTGMVGMANRGIANYGVWGSSTIAKNSGTNVGVIGFGLNTGTTPIHVGGYFALADHGTSAPTLISAALMADNGSTTSDIFVARDNGTIVFKIADGGVTTLTAPVTLKGYTVATLPAGVQGQVAFVTDALAPTFLVTIAGGGAIVTPVFFNGTNWVAG